MSKQSPIARIAICQLPLFRGTREELFEDIVRRDKEMHEQKVDLVVYPWSYFGVGAGTTEDLISAGNLFFYGWMRNLAEHLRVPTLLPFRLNTQKSPFMDIAFLEEGEISFLFTGDMDIVTSPELGFDAQTISFSVKDVEYGLAFDSTCLDVFSDGSVDVDVLLYIPFLGVNCATRDYGGFFSYVQGDLEGIAKEANAFFVNVNGVGLVCDAIYAGASHVVSPLGQTMYIAPLCEPQIKVIDLSSQHSKRPYLPSLNPEFYAMFPYPMLVRALKDFVSQSGFRGVELLLTGDFATSFAALLAADAVGPKNVCAVKAPFVSRERARVMDEIVRALGVSVEELSPEELAVCKTYKDTRIPYVAGAFTFERARAKKFCRITAEDQTALALGQDLDSFANADFAPFSSLLRTDLVRQAKKRNLRSPVIPEACFTETGLNYSGSRLYQIISDGFSKASQEFLDRWKKPSLLIDDVFNAYLYKGMREEILYTENPDIAMFAPHILRVFKKYAHLHYRLPQTVTVLFPPSVASFFPLGGAWHNYDTKSLTEDDLLHEADVMSEEIASKLEAFFSAELEEADALEEDQEFFDAYNEFMVDPLMQDQNDSFFGTGLMGDN